MNEINTDCDIKHEGYGALMSELNSLIGLKQMGDVSSLIQKQRINGKKWNEVLLKVKDVIPLKLTPHSLPNYWVYGIIADNKNGAIEKFRKAGYYATSVHINNNRYSIFNIKKN